MVQQPRMAEPDEINPPASAVVNLNSVLSPKLAIWVEEGDYHGTK
jgi:hypothetical protein